jgi:tetratricopeptide (TPR) repeat protein
MHSALDNHKYVLQTRLKRLGEEHPDVLWSKAKIAHLMRDMGQLEQAETLERDVLQKFIKMVGLKHSWTQKIIKSLATTLEAKGKIQAAHLLHKDTDKKTRNTRWMKAASLHAPALSWAHTNHGDLAQAEDVERKRLEANLKTLGIYHMETLGAKARLAKILHHRKDYVGAETLFREVVGCANITVGEAHPNMMSANSNLALMLRAAGRLDESIAIFEEVVTLAKECHGVEHPQSLWYQSNLAEAFSAANQTEKALSIHVEVFKTRRLRLGEKHPDTLTAACYLAKVLIAKKNFKDAAKLQGRVADAREETLGADHPHTLYIKNNLAHTKCTLGDLDGSLKLHEEVLAGRMRVKGSDHPLTKASEEHVRYLSSLIEDRIANPSNYTNYTAEDDGEGSVKSDSGDEPP